MEPVGLRALKPAPDYAIRFYLPGNPAFNVDWRQNFNEETHR